MEYLTIKKYIEFTCKDITAYIFKVTVKDILPLYYVAVRGRDKEAGAVQRVLNKNRIEEISKYVLNGNMFLNTFILNWANDKDDITINENEIIIPRIASSMQIIDGQHRMEGIKRACEQEEKCGDKEIIVVLTNKLNTSQAAEIFLNINYEQKQVPKSLVYDLFGEVEGNRETAINRAREISMRLNEDVNSSFYQCVKLPGTANRGKVDLSTMITAIKEFVKIDGNFFDFNITEFEMQYKAISNYHQVVKDAYGEKWLSTENPFITNAGYYALMKFFGDFLLQKCALDGSFEVEHIKSILDFGREPLLMRADLKNLQGKEQRQRVYDYLKTLFTKGAPSRYGYKF